MFTLEFDPQLSILVAAFSGVVDDELFVKAFIQMTEIEAVKKDLLVDFSEVTTAGVSVGGIRNVASLYLTGEAITADRKVAVLAPRDDVFGLARMYEMMRPASKTPFLIFRDRQTALAWLQK